MPFILLQSALLCFTLVPHTVTASPFPPLLPTASIVHKTTDLDSEELLEHLPAL
ncbi:hypothetical protein GLYMA_13G065100v4 [Glycine max]|uniref:Uncharacterized protein n=2 Tax=Glycine subgen. Soja TaxID=1462606 RepID=A0A0R0GJB8_SOYBN|nr:hypothetical protein JHK87_035405 [Glycine soja]KAH1100123.1 hypothetical protein GYH30_035339 [Glycine max]KRH18506.1 hypothetical protein GLYMA_13G065100v4 [Glycine max]RZB71174.1 hypothetical protein D0Y65_035908 [Glycine soja]